MAHLLVAKPDCFKVTYAAEEIKISCVGDTMDIHQLRAFRDELEKRAFGIPLVRTQDLTPAALAGLKRMGVKNPDGLDVSELAAQMNVDEFCRRNS